MYNLNNMKKIQNTKNIHRTRNSLFFKKQKLVLLTFTPIKQFYVYFLFINGSLVILEKNKRYIYTILIERGDNILGKGKVTTFFMYMYIQIITNHTQLRFFVTKQIAVNLAPSFFSFFFCNIK